MHTNVGQPQIQQSHQRIRCAVSLGCCNDVVELNHNCELN